MPISQLGRHALDKKACLPPVVCWDDGITVLCVWLGVKVFLDFRDPGEITVGSLIDPGKQVLTESCKRFGL